MGKVIGGNDLCVLVGPGVYADQGLNVGGIQVYRAVDDYVPGSDSDVKKLGRSMPPNSYGARVEVPYGFVESVSVDGKIEWKNVDIFPEAGRNSFHGRGNVEIKFVATRESDEVARAVLAINVGLREEAA